MPLNLCKPKLQYTNSILCHLCAPVTEVKTAAHFSDAPPETATATSNQRSSIRVHFQHFSKSRRGDSNVSSSPVLLLCSSLKYDTTLCSTMSALRHINVRPGSRTVFKRLQGRDPAVVHYSKGMCVCDGCCHTEADRLTRCEGGGLPGLSGHV